MSASISKVQIDDRQVWCVCWRSPSHRSSSYWYFEQEAEAAAAHERLQSWENGEPYSTDHRPNAKRA